MQYFKMCYKLLFAILLLLYSLNLSIASGLPIRQSDLINDKVKGAIKVSTSSTSDEPNPKATDVPSSVVWGHLRVAASLLDLTTDGKYCEESINRLAVERPDFRGGKNYCIDISGDNTGDYLKTEKSDKLINNVIPDIQKELSEKLIIIQKSGKLTVPKYQPENKVCSSFTIPANHQNDGLADADMVIYFAAGPVSDDSKEQILWVEKCDSNEGNPVVIVMNFNPRKISDTANLADIAVSEIMTTLGIESCSDGTSTTITKDEKENKPINLNCVNKVCEDTETLETEQKDSKTFFKCSSKEVKVQTGQLSVSQNAGSTPEVSVDGQQANKDTFSISEKWKPIRIGTSVLDFDNKTKFCIDTVARTAQHNVNDMRGSRTHCSYHNDKDKSDVFNETKKKTILEKIIPAIKDEFMSVPLIRQMDGALVIPTPVDNLCSHFTVPAEQTTTGVSNTDLMIYFAAAPLKGTDVDDDAEEEEYDEEDSKKLIPAWAVPCAILNGRVVSMAVNINPAKIMDTDSTITFVKSEIHKILGTSKCPGTQHDVLFGGITDLNSIESSVCVGVKCEEDNKVKVQEKDNSDWKECTDGQKLSLNGEQSSVQCPKYEDICTNQIKKQETELLKQTALPEKGDSQSASQPVNPAAGQKGDKVISPVTDGAPTNSSPTQNPKSKEVTTSNLPLTSTSVPNQTISSETPQSVPKTDLQEKVNTLTPQTEENKENQKAKPLLTTETSTDDAKKEKEILSQVNNTPSTPQKTEVNPPNRPNATNSTVKKHNKTEDKTLTDPKNANKGEHSKEHKLNGTKTESFTEQKSMENEEDSTSNTEGLQTTRITLYNGESNDKSFNQKCIFSMCFITFTLFIAAKV